MVFSLLNGGTDGTIRGKVTDIEGVPMAGANIYIPSIGIGAAADADGNYIEEQHRIASKSTDTLTTEHNLIYTHI